MWNRRVMRSAKLVGAAAACVGAMLAGSAHAAPVRGSSPAPGGVFVVTYAPVPLTSKLSEIRVRFTVTGRAQPGWVYYVYLVVPRPKSKKTRCAWVAASWNPKMVRRVPHISGVDGQTYTVWLRAAKSLGGHFCPGKGSLDIGTAPTGHEERRRRLLRRVPVTIRRA